METMHMHGSRDFDAFTALTDDVHLVRWPDQEDRRQELRQAGAPRILLLAGDAAPPEHWDELEDWVRLPFDPQELRSRARPLRDRARTAARPVLDREGLLRVGDRWVDIPAAQVPVVELLVAHFGDVVYAELIEKVYLEHGGSPQDSARKAMIVRLRRRLGEVGLTLHNVRDSGYLLDWHDDVGATRPSDRSGAS
jgi:DNA-binding response OmpR family regulator